MKHFLGFLAFVFAGLSLALFLRSSDHPGREDRPVVRVFAPKSFVTTGPGRWLKQIFEKDNNCRVEFIDGADSATLFQRLKSESRIGADLVIGLDQFDLDFAAAEFEWRRPEISTQDFDEVVRPALLRPEFIPYDWSVLAFVLRPSQVDPLPRRLEDLLSPHWKGQISIPDPRTSSVGLQFFNWLVQTRGETGGFAYLRALDKQMKNFPMSWAMAWGLFMKGQVKAVFSYSTSPVFNLLEEKDMDVVAVEFEEGHPIQVEYAAIPSVCKNCGLAEKFLQLMLSPEGQKIIMEKNYMFPVLRDVKEGTAFANVPPLRTLPVVSSVSMAGRERILKKWQSLRRDE